jgi:hypothetical protein
MNHEEDFPFLPSWSLWKPLSLNKAGSPHVFVGFRNDHFSILHVFAAGLNIKDNQINHAMTKTRC